ncbi:hypothetical protein Pint_05347 [Pistacia integerrima]|uniref:Uncharacterized protein n=1 Tax=Pistacia integerrima TaxID=434235 RepID=A0ACC0Z1M7_9ROSI|nr:hypothetical protein Pint_05347 [Pistacia integerrima]
MAQSAVSQVRNWARGSVRKSGKKADYVVARDGSGTYKTINEALDALRKKSKRPSRVIIYVKSGKYNERVEIESSMKNMTFVGDGINRTIVNGSENHADGTETSKSATFDRKTIPELRHLCKKTTGWPTKYDNSTRTRQSHRNFNSRIAHSTKHLFKSYLGRPGKEYSRAVITKTDIDGIIDPEGWREWNESKLELSTFCYAEHLNTGDGALNKERVKWPGFHVLNSSQEPENFTVTKFIQGETWIPETGVPFWPRL